MNCTSLEPWDETQVYDPSNSIIRVTYNGIVYQGVYWTQGEVPDLGGGWSFYSVCATLNELPTINSSFVDTVIIQSNLTPISIDADILDERFTPTHGTKEPNGPDIEQVKAAIDTVMATGKVAVAAVVSVYGEGEGKEIMVESGMELIRGCLASWRTYGGQFR